MHCHLFYIFFMSPDSKLDLPTREVLLLYHGAGHLETKEMWFNSFSLWGDIHIQPSIIDSILGCLFVVCGVLISMVHLSLYIIVYKNHVSYLPRGRCQLFYYSPLVWYCLKKYVQEKVKDINLQEIEVRIYTVIYLLGRFKLVSKILYNIIETYFLP